MITTLCTENTKLHKVLCYEQTLWPSIYKSPAPTGTLNHACLGVSQLLSNHVPGSQIYALEYILNFFQPLVQAPGIEPGLQIHVQCADHYTMADEWGLQDTHPVWRSQSCKELASESHIT